MALAIQEPEVQFAQRLASNEKPIRTKAIKKLRKYLSIRSQKVKGGFTIDDLLKIWKGLFYCLWMQDKPLLQEELSEHISKLMHCMQNTDVQFLFLECFLKTVNREWNGIDRLRMDKFYMLVRFMFREAFEMLKRTDWEASLVQTFLELLNSQVLNISSNCPAGVQFHVLDIYMEELAKVGAKELTADQNLLFIDPFCKTVAKSKNKLLVQAICSSIFKDIVDKAPFAIEDLMREIEAGGVSATDAQEEEEDKGMQESESEVGPVLQFDYNALADRLVQLASRNNTPAFNRKKLYKEVKTFQDLSRGVFPQDEYPEDVSTDEDDDMFGSRWRLKKRKRNSPDENEDGDPKAKKQKGKKGTQDSTKKKGLVESEDPVHETSDTAVKKKKRRKKKKGVGQSAGDTDRLKQDEGSAGEVLEKCVSSVTGGMMDSTSAVMSQPEGRGDVPACELDSEGHGVIQRAPDRSDKTTVEPHVGEETSPGGSTPGQKKSKPRKRKSTLCGQEDEKLQGSPCNMAPAKRVQNGPLASETQNGEVEEAVIKTGTLTGTQALQETNKEKTKKEKKGKNKQVTGEPNDGTGSVSSRDERPEMESPTHYLRKKMKRQSAAGDCQGAEEDSADANGHLVGSAAKKLKKNKHTDIIPGPVMQKGTLGTRSAFVRFHSPSAPVPLFCRKSKGSPGTPLLAKTSRTPKSELKKVTFGLKNNRTAEFRKMDRSVLLNPEGSSRVPFDPQQKPHFSVLKSPAAQSNRKTNMSSVTGRACAADFF